MSSYLWAMEDILSLYLDSVTVCFVQPMCSQGICCKITGKWHPFKYKGPAGGLLLFAFILTPSSLVHVVVNRIQSATAFCQSVYVDFVPMGFVKGAFHREQWSMPFSLLTYHTATETRTHRHTCTQPHTCNVAVGRKKPQMNQKEQYIVFVTVKIFFLAGHSV